VLPCAAPFCFQREPCPIRLGRLKRGCRRSQHAACSRTKYSTVQYSTVQYRTYCTAWWYSLLTRGQIEQHHRSTTCYGLLCSLCYGIASRLSSLTSQSRRESTHPPLASHSCSCARKAAATHAPCLRCTVRRLCFGLQAMEEWKHWRLLLLRDPSLSRRHRGTGTQASSLQN
jgi:hypothetical protein